MMYCLTNTCYVCLKKKDNLISSVNSSVSVNEELRRIIGYLAFNQPWLKTKRIILTCEECYSLLRESYQFLKMWHKNTAVLQGYIDLLNTTTMPNSGNEAELHVHINIKQADVNDVKREVKLEDEQIYTYQWEHNIEETEDTLIIEETNDVFRNLEESFVKEENIWKREEVDDTVECPMDNNATENIEEADNVLVNLEDSSVKEDNKRIREELNDTEEYAMGSDCTGSIIGRINESDSEIALSDDADLTNTDGVSSGFAGNQMHATKEDDLNTATKKSYKCLTCSKCFITKTELNRHTGIHADRKSFECAICKKRCNRKAHLVIHMRVHTGIKPHECTTCKKCFATRSTLVTHMRIHTGEKPYECTTCKKCFIQHSQFIHHMRSHTGEKPFECATCKKCYTQRSHLVDHMRTHTGEKPYECDTCKKCFGSRSLLRLHLRTHTGEKPYNCALCSQRFSRNESVKKHMRRKHADEEAH